MVHNWYNTDWWRRNDSGCTPDEMLNMLNMQIIIDHFPRIREEDKNTTNIGGIVSQVMTVHIYIVNSSHIKVFISQKSKNQNSI